jgi:hypothetical protein
MMSNILSTSARTLRGTDTNSLLRLHDEVNGFIRATPLVQERERAGKVLQRVLAELDRRGVPPHGGSD